MIIETIDLFLKQSKKNELSTKGYLSSYKDCKVKVSFGKGRISNVPWVAFLKGNNEIRSGIYPVILYYKKIETIVIAFGIGTYFEAIKEWEIEKKYKSKTIKNQLSKNYDGIIPYGKCYIYSYYEVNDKLDLKMINDDIDSVIEIYKGNNAK
jgi:5-methylcytosine-specific restriction protein B